MADTGTGVLWSVDLRTELVRDIARGLDDPAEVRLDASGTKAYISESSRGEVVEVDLVGRRASTVASGLDSPVGLAVDDDGAVWVVEPRLGRLVKVDVGTRQWQVFSTGLPNSTAISILPQWLGSAIRRLRQPSGDPSSVLVGLKQP